MQKEKIITLAKKYYCRNDIAKALANYAKNRETIPKYFNTFGKRPDIIEYANDVKALALKNATSFHCSVELWQDPLKLSTGLNEKQLNELRIGWDLLIDIDCPFLDYSKETALLVIKALEWHGIKGYGIKFSGNKGFHIILSHKAFPEEVKGIKIKDFFPEGPRIIATYLSDFILKELRDIILSISSVHEISKAIGKNERELMLNGRFNPYSIISIDTMLMSSRHLYRMPYSLHEKTGLVSVVLNKEELRNFLITLARPQSVEVKDYIKKPDEEEARELLINALDWQDKEKLLISLPEIKVKKIETKEFKPMKFKIENIEDTFCGCIKKILEGIKQDGRKRALFILITFLRSLGFDWQNIEEKIKEWNKKNYKPLRDSYISGQINWFKKQTKTLLPPNHDQVAYYKDIGVLTEECNIMKNPVAYTMRRIREIKKNKRFKRNKRILKK